MKNLVEAFGGKEPEGDAGFFERDVFCKGKLCGSGGVFVTDIWIESGNEHERTIKIFTHFVGVSDKSRNASCLEMRQDRQLHHFP